MPTRKLIPLPSVSNVAAGSQASCRCPVGLTYDAITFQLSGTTFDISMIKNVEIRINGKVVQYYDTLTQLDNFNKYWGRQTSANGLITLWFTRPEIENVNMWLSRLLAFGTSDVDTFDILFDIDGAAVAPAVKLFALQSEAAPLGLITKIKAFPRTFATSGQQEIDSIPRGNFKSGVRIAAIHLINADITDLEIDINSIKILQANKALIQQVQADNARVPLTTSLTADFILDGDLYRALSTAGVQDFRIKPTISASGLVNTVVEYLDSFEGV